MATVDAFCILLLNCCAFVALIIFTPVLCTSTLPATTATTTTVSTVPLTTTTTTTTTTAPPTATPIPANTDLAYCICNLRQAQCDVNCCCDTDCTDSDRRSFSFCMDTYTPVNTEACVQSDVIFVNNTPYQSYTSGGLFCIYYDNYKSANFYNVPSLITNNSVFDDYLSRYATPFSYSAQQQTSITTNNTQYYVSGDPILTVYNSTLAGNGSLGMLALPAAAAASTNCLNTNPAAYLYSQTHTCVQPLPNGLSLTECTSNVMLNAATFYENFKIVSTPALLNISVNSSLPSNVPLYDNEYLRTIVPDSVPQKPLWINSSNQCQNVVVKVEYKLWYSGTAGITNATVKFTLGNINATDVPLTQTFLTSFYKTGTDDANITVYSGNPGYIVGQPVRAGNLTTSGSAIDMSSNSSQWLTIVTSSAGGSCINDVNNRKSVTFGVNMRSGCFVSMPYTNMTSLCNMTQYAAINALLGNSRPEYIASFGNTTVEKVGDWVKILEKVPSTCSRTSVPTSTEPGTCMNIITGMNIQIVYANVGAINNPQPQIIGAEYQFICQPVLRFQCVGPYCQPSTIDSKLQRFEVTSSVSFVDASTPPVGAYGQIPTVSSSLPADFFYPFT